MMVVNTTVSGGAGSTLRASQATVAGTGASTVGVVDLVTASPNLVDAGTTYPAFGLVAAPAFEGVAQLRGVQAWGVSGLFSLLSDAPSIVGCVAAGQTARGC